MVVELKAKSQVTIPAAIVKSLGLSQGDLFDVEEHDGQITFIPIVTMPMAEAQEMNERAERDRQNEQARKRFGELFDEMRQQAKEAGVQGMTLEEINEEIKAARQERAARQESAEGKEA